MNRHEQKPQPPVEIPPAALNETTLKAVIESFIMREGTDYGRQEVDFETKSQQVLKQIQKGHVRIIFDPGSESINLLTEKEWKRLQAQMQSQDSTWDSSDPTIHRPETNSAD